MIDAGRLSLTSGQCGVCRAVHSWGTVFRTPRLARRWARLEGWTFAPPLNWICRGCLARRPSDGPGPTLRERRTEANEAAQERKRARIQARRDRRAAYMRSYRARILARPQTTAARVFVEAPRPPT